MSQAFTNCRINAGESIMNGLATPKRVPVNGKLAAAAPLRSPQSAGGVIRCVCENNIERGMMVQCEVCCSEIKRTLA